MSDSLRYNIFLLISSISRNLIELFSLVFLYKMGYSIKDILLFLLVMYSIGLISNTLAIYLSSKIGYKFILIISNLIFAFSYYYLSIMSKTTKSLIILAILMSFGNYMYHSIRHLVGMMIKNINISIILISNYIGIMFTSLIGAYITDKFSLSLNVILVIIISIISLIPLIKLKETKKETINLKNVKIPIKKKLYFIAEQFKVIFCELQGLFLYLYIDNNLIYLGIFNLFIGISSIIFLLYLNKIKENTKYYKYFNIILCLILFLKINLKTKNLLYIIALLEGLFLKEFEYFTTKNLYNQESNNTYSYLTYSEIIFILGKSLIMLIFYLFIDNIYLIETICIFGIFICTFLYPIKKVSRQ